MEKENIDFKTIIDETKNLDKSIFTLNKLLILILLDYFQDGLQYRELKEMLNFSDGNLASHLSKLNELEYLVKYSINFDKKELDVYNITAKGKNKIMEITNWMEKVNDILKEGEIC